MPKPTRANLVLNGDVKFRENPKNDFTIGQVVYIGKNCVKIRMKTGRLHSLSLWYCTTDIIKPLK